jgi:hypothetical protein
MSNTSSRGPGRPAGSTADTRQKRRDFLLLYEFGMPVAQIAERAGVKASWVWDMLKKGRADIAAERPPDLTQPAPAELQKSQPLRRLSRRIAQSRAWDYADRRPSFALGLAANSFWVRIIMATHEDGDGFRLRIGEEGSRFRARADLAILLLGHLDRQDVHVDDWLKALFEHGRLVDLGVDIGIPSGLGLVPGENSRGEPLKPKAPAKQSASSQAPLPFRPTLVPEWRPDSGEIPLSDSTNIPISPESDSSENPDFGSAKTPILPESAEFAHWGTVDVDVKESQSLNTNINNGSPAPTTPVKFGITVESDSGEIPRHDSSDINSERSSLVDLATGLMVLANFDRLPNGGEIGCVGGWRQLGASNKLDAATSIEVTQSVIKNRTRRCSEGSLPKPETLHYFDKEVRKALLARSHGGTSLLTAAAPAPLSDADKTLRDLLRPSQDAWRKDRSCPFAPTLETFRAACLTEKGKTLAYRWLELWAVWDRSNRPSDLKPPDFTLIVQDPERFETALLEIEEEITAPDPPQAAD